MSSKSAAVQECAAVFFVLGGLYGRTVGSSDDVNNVTTTGIYVCNGDAVHLPSAATYLLEVINRDSNNIVQKAYKGDGSVTYVRVFRSSWSSWKEIATDIPSFYKSYIDLAALVSGIDASKRYTAVNGMNYNNVITNCTYVIPTATIASATGLPSDAVYGVLTVTAYDTQRIVQTYRGIDNNRYKKVRRTENNGTLWSDWVDDDCSPSFLNSYANLASLATAINGILHCEAREITTDEGWLPVSSGMLLQMSPRNGINYYLLISGGMPTKVYVRGEGGGGWKQISLT